jgi:hypothetical protein
VVAGLGELSLIEEAKMPLAELKVRDRTLAVVESTLARHYRNRKGIDHILEGFRKAGWEE